MENKVNSSGASGPVTGATGSYVSCWADVQIPKLFMSSKRINMFVTEADSEEQFHRILDFMWAVWCRLRRFDHESVCQLYSLLFDFCFEVYDEKSIFFLISTPALMLFIRPHPPWISRCSSTTSLLFLHKIIIQIMFYTLFQFNVD